MSTRPVLVYLSGGDGTTGCGDGHTDCVKRIFLVGTPALWWISLFVLGWALWRCIARMDWRYAAVLVAYGAGYLPWFAIWTGRCTSSTWCRWRRSWSSASPWCSATSSAGPGTMWRNASPPIAVVAIFVGLVVANFIWMWPILNGDPITPARLVAETWLPSWG